jgi:2-dehydro-3-deoxygalactonokinase
MLKTFLSCDWGTSSFRLRLIDVASGQIIAASTADEGIAAVYALWKQSGAGEKERIGFYRPVIQKHIKRIEQDTAGSTANIPVIISGMASSSMGMVELPYTEFPFLLNGDDLQYKKIEQTAAFPHDLVIISGAKTDNDVIRGEEIQLIGCVAGDAAARQLFIFPGTHSKHIAAAAGSAVDAATFMTGEFFELLSAKSILSDSLAAGTTIEDDENKPAFEQGIKDSLQQNLLHYSFMVRTNQLFKRFSKTANYFYLSGLLIGTELSQLSKTKTEAITIVGDKILALNYLLAIKVLGIDARTTIADAATATIRGQMVICRRLYQ